MELRRINQSDREAVDAFIVRQWYTLDMVVHGEVIDLGTADGWLAYEDNAIVGLITYHVKDGEMEILSLDSLHEGVGIGTALLDQAVTEARELGCSRVMLITTNDNLSALRFYQKRGFDLARLYRNALERARQIKPEIPLVGTDGIPLRHEIELELVLGTS